MLAAMAENLISPGHDASDEALVARYVAGDARALCTLFDRHHRALYHFIFRYTREPGASEDLLQETFIRVMRNAVTYRPEAKFTTWLFTLARNLSIDFLRRKKREIAHANNQSDEDGVSAISPHHMVEQSELQRVLMTALEQIPEEQREVFLLREIGDLSFVEIAELLGCPENTVKSRMRYATAKLRSLLFENGSTDGIDHDP